MKIREGVDHLARLEEPLQRRLRYRSRWGHRPQLQSIINNQWLVDQKINSGQEAFALYVEVNLPDDKPLH